MQMIYLSTDELEERIIKSRRHTNQLPKDPNQSLAERSAEVLYHKLAFFLGTDRQEYYVQSVLRYLKITIKEKVNANANDILNK